MSENEDTFYTTDHIYYTQVTDGAIVRFLQGPIGATAEYLRQNAIVGPVPESVTLPEPVWPR